MHFNFFFKAKAHLMKLEEKMSCPIGTKLNRKHLVLKSQTNRQARPDRPARAEKEANHTNVN